LILIGQYDSSFVRRVGIALRLYDLPFEHRPWSVFSDADKVRALNPLGRVPILVLDGGEVLTDSAAILDHLDEQAGTRALMPRSGPGRRAALRIITLATGIAERAVSLFYARHLVEGPAPALTGRLEGQITATLAALETERAARPDRWLLGPRMSHADIAVACALTHVAAALPDLWNEGSAHPALAAHSAMAEALPVFRDIHQPFVGPSGQGPEG